MLNHNLVEQLLLKNQHRYPHQNPAGQDKGIVDQESHDKETRGLPTFVRIDVGFVHSHDHAGSNNEPQFRTLGHTMQGVDPIGLARRCPISYNAPLRPRVCGMTYGRSSGKLPLCLNHTAIDAHVRDVPVKATRSRITTAVRLTVLETSHVTLQRGHNTQLLSIDNE